jgi:F420-non-reducing hydrogenase iron-sulfur subunit
MITGCHIGDCHYIDGNLYAKRKFSLLKRLVEKAGLEKGRVMLEWVSASEGQKFADVVTGFIDRIKKLGPTPAAENPEIRQGLLAAQAAAEAYRLRALVGKEEKLENRGNVYGDKLSQDELDRIMDEAVDKEYTRNRIKLLLKEPMSVKGLSEKLGIDSKLVLEHIVILRQRGWVDLYEVRGHSPFYKAMEVA